jgi:hypothetical protein
VILVASGGYGRRLVAPRRVFRRDLGEAEIENLGVAVPGDEDIGGLDVPMDDTLAVGGIEPSVISIASVSSDAVSSGRLPIRCLSVTPSRNPDRPR